MRATSIFSFFIAVVAVSTGLHAQQIDLTKINQKVKQGIDYSVTLSGKIADSVSNESIAYGSVLLTRRDDGSDIGVNTDSAGYFHFENVAPGAYHLSAFYVGYPKLEKELTIDSSAKDVNLGTLYLAFTTNALTEIKVVDYKDLVEQRPDGLVYHADKDGTNKGTTADQLLRKVPMLSVDLEGNVSMRGNGNIKVLINGKPSTIIAATVKDALKQIPSDEVKSVEVITSPGAKYDAEGAAGVINIITKKSVMKGISGMVFTGVNYNAVQQTVNGYGGVNLNYRRNKFGLSANIGGGRWTNENESKATRRDLTSASSPSLVQESVNSGKGPFIWSRISGDYDIDSLNLVSLGVGYRPGNWESEISQVTTLPQQGVSYWRQTDMEMPRATYSVNGSYQKKSAKDPKRTLDILGLYTVNQTESKYFLTQYELPSLLYEDYRERNLNIAKNKELTLQADYVYPFKKHHQKLETGLKYINRNVLSDYALSRWQPGDDGFSPDPFRTNLLTYRQQVAAAYGQFTSDLTSQLSVIGGLRYEYTHIHGHLRDNGGDFNSDFHNLMPSAILSWDLKHFNKLKLSYNQRIERPSIGFINPYVNSSDPWNISSGNPELEPELTHNVELGYNTILGKTTLNLSSFYSRTNNAIEAMTLVDANGINRTTFGNYARNNTWGFNFYGATRLFNRWMINLNGNLYHKDLQSRALDIRNQGWQYDLHLYSSVQIVDGLSIEGFGMYSDRKIALQGYTSGWFYYMLGVKKSILKGKADLSLVAENFFSPNIAVNTYYQYGNTDYQTESLYRARGFRLSFSWRFGKMSFSGPEKKVNNDDLKEKDQQGAGQNQMGGM